MMCHGYVRGLVFHLRGLFRMGKREASAFSVGFSEVTSFTNPKISQVVLGTWEVYLEANSCPLLHLWGGGHTCN